LNTVNEKIQQTLRKPFLLRQSRVPKVNRSTLRKEAFLYVFVLMMYKPEKTPSVILSDNEHALRACSSRNPLTAFGAWDIWMDGDASAGK
jgi:hypothetical protein